MMKIVIMESLGISDAELDELEAPFIEEGHCFVSYPKTADNGTLIREARDADVMILANMPMPAEVIRKCPKLKYIDIAFTGVDHVGMEAAREQNITVSNASGYATEAVSELVFGMLLSLMRRIPAVDLRCRAGGTKAGLIGNEIAGKTIGIVGLGHIGSRTAELFHAFGAKILATSQHVHEDAPDYVQQVTLNELLGESDAVILHCPLNDSTRGLIDAEKLARMKPTAFLINVARGPVVVTRDLANALNSNQIAGAGIDVFDVEPPLPEGEPLVYAKNTVLTPHVAFATEESMSKRAAIVFDNLAAFIKGEPKNVVK